MLMWRKNLTLFSKFRMFKNTIISSTPNLWLNVSKIIFYYGAYFVFLTVMVSFFLLMCIFLFIDFISVKFVVSSILSKKLHAAFFFIYITGHLQSMTWIFHNWFNNNCQTDLPKCTSKVFCPWFWKFFVD